MKILKIAALLLVPILFSAGCGDQLVEFGDSSDAGNIDAGDSAAAGTSGSDGGGAGSGALDAGEVEPDAAADAGPNADAGLDAAADASDTDGGNDAAPFSPRVTSTNPEDEELMVAVNKTITATFSETMNPGTITDLSFTVMDGAAAVSGAITFSGSAETFTAAFTPDNDLAPDTLFTATVTTAATDLAGNALHADYIWTFTTGTNAAQTIGQAPVPLGSAFPFVILASAGITNIPTSMITGDVGLTPDAASNITGFSMPATCPEVIGTMYVVDESGPACAVAAPTVLTDAKLDAEAAFINATDAVRGTPQAIAGDLNGLTLYPGLYESGSSLEISPGGLLYLDAQGDENAVFIIRSATSITTEDMSEVVLTKGAKATNVYWTAGSAVTLGTDSTMKGTLIAGTAISLLTGANLEGRALNQGAAAEAVTLDSCTITLPLP